MTVTAWLQHRKLDGTLWKKLEEAVAVILQVVI
jgi:hypothetical protein